MCLAIFLLSFFFSLVISTTSCWPREERAHGVAGAKGAVEAQEPSPLEIKVSNRPVLFTLDLTQHREALLFINVIDR